MKNNDTFGEWVASIERGHCGFTYVRFYRDAPAWVRNEAINHFGKGTVFLPPSRLRRLPTETAA